MNRKILFVLSLFMSLSFLIQVARIDQVEVKATNGYLNSARASLPSISIAAPQNVPFQKVTDFNVSVWLNSLNPVEVFGFQVGMVLDDTIISVSDVWIPETNSSWIFHDKDIVVNVEPYLSDEDNNSRWESAKLGSTLIGTDSKNITGQVLLAIIELRTWNTGTAILNISETVKQEYPLTFLLDPDLNEIPITRHDKQVNISFPVYNLDTDLNYLTIQEAIDANETLDGHTIFVEEGTYYENVVLNKSLSLAGKNSEKTIIDGNGSGTVVLIQPISTPTITSISISNFTIRNSGLGDYSGIYLRNSARINISHNLITNNYYGVRLRNSFYNMITNNTITDNEYGISSEVSPDNVLSDNVVTSNFLGVFFQNSNENLISRNIISSNMVEGMNFIYCRSNIISGNDIIDNNPGMYFFNSSNNIIIHNNFNNTNQIVANEMRSNYWDNGREGNYWSDYTGIDTDQDGIGDTNHTVDGNNIDRHPLMGSFNSFNTPLGKPVNIISNSTIERFEYELNSTIRLYISNSTLDQSVGFCRVTIPKDVLSPPYIIVINDGTTEVLYYHGMIENNGTHRWIIFEYKHSQHKIEIIPEFPSLLILPLFVIATLTSIIIHRRKIRFTNARYSSEGL